MKLINVMKNKIKPVLLVLTIFLPGCEMTDMDQNNYSREETSSRNNPNSTVEITYENEDNNTLENSLVSNLDITYYKNAQGKTGQELKKSLHEIISEQSKIPSKEKLKSALVEIDEDPNNSNNVILLYAGRSQPKGEYGTGPMIEILSTFGTASHGKFERYKKGPGTDLHHVRPEDHSINGSRSSLDFDFGGEKQGEAPDTFYDKDSWEPRDEVKGDIARMLFYMAVRYEGDQGEPNLELINDVNLLPHIMESCLHY